MEPDHVPGAVQPDQLHIYTCTRLLVVHCSAVRACVTVLLCQFLGQSQHVLYRLALLHGVH